mmetsp:Transcript_3158/g.4613  ORF Transcript_3158/g.4613 Transcript_3158/m.4613 type:complete len:1282 (-) Transcript_3158:2285-6130(-)
MMASNNPYAQYNQPPPPGGLGGGDSYASRSAQAYGSVPQNQNPHGQQQHQPSFQATPNQSFQQPQYYAPSPPVTQQAPANNYNYNQNTQPPPQPQQYNQTQTPAAYHTPNPSIQKLQSQTEQNRLNASIRRMQEATHIMRGAMDADDLPTTLDRAAAMLGELGDPKHHHHHHHSQNSHSHSSSSSSAIMSPKHYYEIHMLAMEELPNIEEYFLSLSSAHSPRYTMKDLYEVTQYTSRAVPRLYLQICAGSALIRSGEEDATVILNDLIQAVKCVQCPIRGLFLRDYLLKAVRDKLPDEVEQSDGPNQQEEVKEVSADVNEFEDVKITETPAAATTNTALANLMGNLTMNMNNNDGFLADNLSPETQETKIPDHRSNFASVNASVNDTTQTLTGRVKDSYQFVLANFIEMNKLWVRIQHLPGDAKNKDTKRRRERERNELRMMVGTNLVRLSELEGVTSAIYGTVILPRILDQIVACRDPLAQAYLMDCIIQVFPDEFHIQTLEVVLSVCSKLRDKVNIKTILQSIMDRLSNYYADELLLNDEEDTEGVKTSVMLDSFEMFDECIRSVLQARGAKITAKEVIRLEASLLDFSLKCYPGRMDYINRCIGVCASCLRGEGTSNVFNTTEPVVATPLLMDDVAVKELETLLSLPLETMGLNILDLDRYSELLEFLPMEHRKRVGLELLGVLYSSGEKMSDLPEIEHLFAIISPLIQDKSGYASPQSLNEKESVSKLIHLLYNEDTDIHFEILNFVKKYLFSSGGKMQTSSHTISPLFYSAMKLLRRVQELEFPQPNDNVEFEGIADDVESDIKESTDEDVEADSDGQVQKQVNDADEDDTMNNDSQNQVQEGVVTDDENVENGHDEQQNGTEHNEGEDNVAEAINEVVQKVSDDQEEETGEDEAEINDSTVEQDTKVAEEAVDGGDEDLSHFPIDTPEPEATLNEEEAEKQPTGDDPDTEHNSNENADNSSLVQSVELEDPAIKDVEQGADEADENQDASDHNEQKEETPVTPKENSGSLFSPIDDTAPAPLVFSKEINCRKIFLFLQKLLSFVEMTNSDLCFNLRLQAAAAANCCALIAEKYDHKSDLAPIAYEFMTEAFLIYEAEITESSAQKNAMVKMIGILLSCDCFERTDYEALITKTTQYAARLLKKTDQCTMVLMCSHLFFKDETYQNPQRVLECLQRALKLADMCTTASPANLQLFVDIFDKYVYYYEKANPYVTDKFISGLIALVNEHINSIGPHNPIIREAKIQFVQTVTYIERNKGDAVLGEKFVTIVCSFPNL